MYWIFTIPNKSNSHFECGFFFLNKWSPFCYVEIIHDPILNTFWLQIFRIWKSYTFIIEPKFNNSFLMSTKMFLLRNSLLTPILEKNIILVELFLLMRLLNLHVVFLLIYYLKQWITLQVKFLFFLFVGSDMFGSASYEWEVRGPTQCEVRWWRTTTRAGPPSWPASGSCANYWRIKNNF